MGNNVKSSGGFVITYRLEDASHDELVSRNLEDASKCQQIRRETAREERELDYYIKCNQTNQSRAKLS